jgi:hypothetical protein
MKIGKEIVPVIMLSLTTPEPIARLLAIYFSKQGLDPSVACGSFVIAPRMFGACK